MRKASSFFNQLTLFKSQKSDESDGDSSLHKQYSSSSKCSNDKKSVMEKEWSKTCGQMDKRAQLLQVIANFDSFILLSNYDRMLYWKLRRATQRSNQLISSKQTQAFV